MLQFAIANLDLPDTLFDVPSALGKWKFSRSANYDSLLPSVDRGMCANTYYAANDAVTLQIDDDVFEAACDEIIDICLVLSFLNARCVTPSGTTGQSDMQFIQLGDDFIRARSIVGFEPFQVPFMTDLVAGWLTGSYAAYQQRRMRLQLSHWLSGLTCFSLEDLYLSAGVQMDIVKQRERTATGNANLNYFQGMTEASSRYGLTALGADYKNMRNDIVHEGVLSGSNFANKSKQDCAAVIASTLNWIDEYVLAVLGIAGNVVNRPRWRSSTIEHSLPAISVR